MCTNEITKGKPQDKTDGPSKWLNIKVTDAPKAMRGRDEEGHDCLDKAPD